MVMTPHAPAATPRVRSVARPKVATATWLTALVVALCAIGLIMVGSAAPAISIGLYSSAWSVLIREGLWMVVGGITFALVARSDYHFTQRFSALGAIASIGLLVAVLVPGIGKVEYGARRWIGVSMLTIQPSEIMKLAIALFAANLAAKALAAGSSPKRILGPVLVVAGLACLLILMQPDLGTAAVVGIIAFAVVFAAGVPGSSLIKVGLAAFAGVAVMASMSSYQRARLASFLDPTKDAAGAGYQVNQSLISLGSGHLTGYGLGAGPAKLGSLPNAHTDFIFSVVGQEFGLFGTIAVLALFLAMITLGIRTATRTSDPYGSLLATAIVTWLGIEVVINVASVVGLMPVTGIPLPFISFGGSSLVITLFAVGLLTSIARAESLDVAVARPVRRRSAPTPQARPRPTRQRTSTSRAAAPRATTARTASPATKVRAQSSARSTQSTTTRRSPGFRPPKGAAAIKSSRPSRGRAR